MTNAEDRVHPVSGAPLESDPTRSPYWRWSKPFYIMMRFLGYMPFELRAGEELVMSRRCWLWAVTAFVLQINIQFAYYIGRLGNPQFWDNYLAMLDSILRFLTSSVLPQFVAAWLSSRLIIDYIMGWREYEKHFERITGRAIPSVGSWFGVLHLSLTLIVIMTLIVWDLQQMAVQVTASTIIPYYFPLTYSFSLSFLSVYNCLFIAQTANVYRFHLNQVLRADCDPATIHQYRMLWLGIHHRAKLFAGTLSPLLLIHIVKWFCVFLFSSYSLVNFLIMSTFAKALPYVGVCLGSLLSLVAISESSYLMSNEVLS